MDDGDGHGDGHGDGDGDGYKGAVIGTSMEPLRTTTTGLSVPLYTIKPFQKDDTMHTIIARVVI